MNKYFKVNQCNVMEDYNVKMKFYKDGSCTIKYYDDFITRLKPGWEQWKKDKINIVDQTLKTYMSYRPKKKDNDGQVRADSVSRSRQIMEDLVKNNHEEFHSSWTLTFKGSPSDKECERMVNIWLTQMRRKYKDFKWVMVAEYQKRNVLHYHLLTSIKPNSELMPKLKQKKLWDYENQKWNEFEYYNLKYWNYGFSQGRDLSLTNDKFKVQKYLMKYMTKDSLQLPKGVKRVRYSRNLEKPKEKVLTLTHEELKTMTNSFRQLGKTVEREHITSYRQYGINITLYSIE